MSAYAATKAGLIGLTRVLAADLGPKIRANAIAPGSIRTERQIKRYENKDFMLAEKPSAAARTRMKMQKLYPYSHGSSEDIAAVALFLASNDSRMLTGTTLAADGGRSTYLKIYDGEE